MSDWKSKLPDMNEITSMSTKLFNSVKGTVSEIIDDYKKKRENEVTVSKASAESVPEKKIEEPKVEALKPEEAKPVEEEKKE
jgi:hypothetical protein